VNVCWLAGTMTVLGTTTGHGTMTAHGTMIGPGTMTDHGTTTAPETTIAHGTTGEVVGELPCPPRSIQVPPEVTMVVCVIPCWRGWEVRVPHRVRACAMACFQPPCARLVA
jgi:hypothetical protein